MSDATAALLAALAAAEPAGTRPLGELLARLAAAGRLRAVEAAPGVDTASGVAAAPGPDAAAIEVRGVAYDSRRVVPGGVFVAVPGAHVDGHDFGAAALAGGAGVIVAEHPLEGVRPPVLVLVDRSQHALATAAAWWYGDPGAELGIVGVTGTDGKTTTAAMCVAALEAAGVRTGLLSTAALKVGAARADALAHVTTPEAPELQRALRAMRAADDVAAVVEATSHGLALERVGEVPFDVAIVTNLSHEHLEFHGTFDAYRAAKRSLFERLGRPVGRPAKPASLPGGRGWPVGGIVNLDDPEADAFASAAREAGARVLTYGTSPAADVRATAIAESTTGLLATVTTPRGTGELRLGLVGRFNVHNALAAVALGELLELDRETALGGLATFAGVRGRMELVDRGQPFTVVVDYAHTPVSLATALGVLAPLVTGDGGLVAVFGSAGERDVAKRPLQGRVAGERCRLVVLTDEDPRGEDRDAIIEQIAAGAEAAGKRRGEDLLLIADREAAIREAFARARRGDVVLLAGKGHETGILYADHELPWDERAVAERLLAEGGH
jgi:UDP-N-acetylmuramoyl-L-alanyl-D-glutamate--2,6-diaminopimelate ligase